MLFEQMLPNSLAILFTSPEYPRTNDESFRFRPNSDFYYLTGFKEPESAIIFIKRSHEQKFIVFNQPKDSIHELWFGHRLGQEGAVNELGADEAYPLEKLETKIIELLSEEIKHFYYSPGYYLRYDTMVSEWLGMIHSKVRGGINPPHEIMNLNGILHEMRLTKSTEEIALIEKSAAINMAAQKRAMKACRPGKYEYELEAEIIYEFTQGNAREVSFFPIIASGENSCVLHYRANERQLQSDDLLLIDSGCEYHYYASDMTRTFPVSGRFTKEQRMVYEIVLKAQQAGIEQMKPGHRWDLSQEAALKVIIEGLRDLGILSGSIREIIEKKSYFPFYMHRFSHWIGIDTHDAGIYKIDGEWRNLKPGMVMSAEPGIYIKAAPHIDKRWWNIGIRIEDTVLITPTGNRLLTKEMPKTISDIEAFMSN